MNKFLFELGTEEIPADMIADGLRQLSEGLQKVLQEQQLAFDRILAYSSPRRLAVLAEGLPERQPDREEITMGPPAKVAFDAAERPTPAAHGFAKKIGVEVDRLEVHETERGPYVVARQTHPGQPAPQVLAAALPDVIASISWPKTMYWRESRYRFIRPLRWLVALWNSDVVTFDFEGVSSDRYTQGHRFLGNRKAEVPDAGSYVSTLRGEFVLVDLQERREKISRELSECTPDGLQVLEDARLRELVAFLNEYPTVLRGGFDPRFLDIPQEVLITVMRHHQKYFAVVDSNHQLQPWFLTVLNTSGDNEGEIQKGHERVLKARLEDAAFFWENDRAKSLEDRVASLAGVMFQKDLGSYLDKTERLRAICKQLSDDPDMDEAARLCKADLTTEMVFEMSELQGVMGGLYARDEGQKETVWRAIYEHYQPVSLDDPPPSSRLGALLSLADRVDTIVGCFNVGIRPTSSSDPFALRRQAQGAVKILLDQKLELSLSELVDLAAAGFESVSPEAKAEALEFLRRRVRFILQERGASYDVLNAIFAVGADRVFEAAQRASALEEIRREPDFEALAVAFKRIRNILTKESEGLPEVRREVLSEKAEIELHEQYLELRPRVESWVQAHDFAGALRALAGLRGAVDEFFDRVMVLTEDREVRLNRLRLLQDLSQMFLRIADISEIVRSE